MNSLYRSPRARKNGAPDAEDTVPLAIAAEVTPAEVAAEEAEAPQPEFSLPNSSQPGTAQPRASQPVPTGDPVPTSKPTASQPESNGWADWDQQPDWNEVDDWAEWEQADQPGTTRSARWGLSPRVLLLVAVLALVAVVWGGDPVFRRRRVPSRSPPRALLPSRCRRWVPSRAPELNPAPSPLLNLLPSRALIRVNPRRVVAPPVRLPCGYTWRVP